MPRLFVWAALFLTVSLLMQCVGAPAPGNETVAPTQPVMATEAPAATSAEPATSTSAPETPTVAAAPTEAETASAEAAEALPTDPPVLALGPGTPAAVALTEYPVPPGSHPHDVAPAPDGTVWYTAQASGELGRLDPASGEVESVDLGEGSSPHGVIVGPDGAAWVTDSGLNAIVRVDSETLEARTFPLPDDARANLNTAAFDLDGILWFTGQSGYYGRLDPATAELEVFEAPGGRGPYGIDAAPDGAVYYASLAGSHIARIDATSGEATVINPPTAGQGARRVWADSTNRIWVSEWNAGQVGVYDPASGEWREWRLPGENPMPYAVYVDEHDLVWLSDFGANALVRFDPATEQFETFPLPSPSGEMRQLLGREGEVWAAESGTDKLVVARY